MVHQYRITGLILALAGVTATPARALELSYAGRIVDQVGAPLQGRVDLVVRFYGSEAGDDQLGRALQFSKVALADGAFQILLGLDAADEVAVFGDGTRRVYVEVEAAGAVFPRQVFAGVPWALRIPIDTNQFEFATDTSKLTLRQIEIGQVHGLEEALAVSSRSASRTSSGYLSQVDWLRFDAKQAPITPDLRLDAASLTTTAQDGIVIQPYGLGVGQTGELRFKTQTDSSYVGFKAPDSVAASQVWILPGAEGEEGSVLMTNGAGTLRWSKLGSGDLSQLDAVYGGAQGTIMDGTITNEDLAASAAIQDLKLASITSAGKVAGSAITAGTIAGATTFAGSGGVVTTGPLISSGNLTINGTGSASTELRFADRDSTHYLGFKAPESLSTNSIWTLPVADGLSGWLLKTDGSGNLSWVSPGGGGDMLAVNNLSDVANKASARTNLGLGPLATMTSVSSSEIVDASLVNADIASSAAISTIKLAGPLTAVAGHGLGALASKDSLGGAEINDQSISDADIATSAAIATTKLSGSLLEVSAHGLGSLASLSTIGSAQITDLSVLDADIAASAGIVDSKLATISSPGKVSGDAINSGNIGGSAAFTGSGGVDTAGVISGSGGINVAASGGVPRPLRFRDADQTNFVALRAANTLAADVTWTLPATDGGVGQVLQTNGAGELSWTSGLAPTGTAGGDLTGNFPAPLLTNTGVVAGTYPKLVVNAQGRVTSGISTILSTDIADDSIQNADIASTAAIATSKLSGPLTAIAGHGLGGLAMAGSIASAQIDNGTIIDADIASTAAIATSKLSGAMTAIAGHGLGSLATASSIVSAQIDNGTIIDADIASTAAIATSKLSGALTAITGHGLGSLATVNFIASAQIDNGTIVDADVASTAAIATSKLSGALMAIAGHGLGGLSTANSIASAQIDNGTIIDTDISSAAAIAGSKINFANDSISGDKIHSGTISDFASTGIDDNSTSLALTINTTGNVGIGTNSPLASLDVAGSGIFTNNLYVNNNRTGTGSGSTGTIQLGDGTLSKAYGSAFAMNSGLYTQGSIGINIATPTSPLHLHGNNMTMDPQGAMIMTRWYQHGSWMAGSSIFHWEDSTDLYDRLSFAVTGYGGIDWSNPNQLRHIKMTIMSDGRVGINTTRPVGKLNIAPDALVSAPTSWPNGQHNEGLAIYSSYENSPYLGTVDLAALRWSDASNGGSQFRFWTQDRTTSGPSVRMVINREGNVGVGTTAPAAKLQVNGQAASVVASISSATVDFNSGNIQTNSVAAGALTLNNMLDGATYTLILTNASGGNYVLSGSGVTAWHCAPVCGSNTVTVVAGTHTVLSLMKVGTNAYVTWINGM